MADLIDRAALLKLFDERLDVSHIQGCIRQTGKTLWHGIKSGVNWGRNTVIEAPAVDAVEVKHGKWSHVAGGRTICNQCGEYPLYDYFGKQKFSNYCPRCGAKMEGIDVNA